MDADCSPPTTPWLQVPAHKPDQPCLPTLSLSSTSPLPMNRLRASARKSAELLKSLGADFRGQRSQTVSLLVCGMSILGRAPGKSRSLTSASPSAATHSHPSAPHPSTVTPAHLQPHPHVAQHPTPFHPMHRHSPSLALPPHPPHPSLNITLASLPHITIITIPSGPYPAAVLSPTPSLRNLLTFPPHPHSLPIHPR
ncbi:hypothetical protein PAPYR_13215 [Paratrimastix pyriformis]|uniref:Uncharacterized protein n=1 Tax=Paratrimastix pyriformis TaxID=342808 RepID=A0ABQ8U722_9EUKA|nr:hypothetical protein PAPYR_13215 [Paratrimastix pyriformis]